MTEINEELKDEYKDNYNDIVISTRVRVARNIENYKFPQIINVKEVDDITENMLNVMKNSEESYKYYKIKDLDKAKRQSYVENHLISPALMHSDWRGSFFLRDDDKVTIMLNEEDHLRIQVLLDGFNLKEALDICSSVDDFIEQDIKYAFHEKYGYLTSCPTNTGTGLRASVMLHLPAITMTNHINTMNEVLRKFGLTMRGLYGEGSEGLGCLYQVSNQTTLGQSEEEIIIKLNKVVGQVIQKERVTRDLLLENSKTQLEDRILRSFGILKYNRQISAKESMSHLSNVKMGVDLNIIDNIPSENIVWLMEKIQPANIQVDLRKDLSREDRDMERSNIIREYFKEWEE